MFHKYSLNVPQAAVDAVHQAGDGMIFVPEGRWLTAPFNLTSHCTLFLDSGALVLVSFFYVIIKNTLMQVNRIVLHI
jgi:polygalacturonase